MLTEFPQGDKLTTKEKFVNMMVHFRTSFVYLYFFVFCITTWMIINISGVVHWDNPEHFTYLNIAISILTELQSVMLLIYVTRIDAHNKKHAEIDHGNIHDIKKQLNGLSVKLGLIHEDIEDIAEEETK